MKCLHSIKFKLIAATLACVALVSLLSSLLLYSYLNYAVDQKSARLQRLYLTTLQQQMDKYISDFCSLVVLAANDRQIGEAMAQHGSINSVMLSAQSRLGVYLRSCPGESYVDKFMAVASDGRLIQAVTRQYGRPVDAETLFDSGIFRQSAEEGFRRPYLLLVGDSIQKEEPVLALLCPIRYSGMPDGSGFIYLELGLDLFTDLLEPYINVNNAFLLGPDGGFLSPRPAALPETFDTEALQSGVVRFGGERWRLESVSLTADGMTLCTAAQLNVLDQDGMHAIFVVGVVFLTGLLLAGVLAFLLSAYLTRPIHRLNDRLKRISANDFSRDPETERSRDEIGEIGRTVNEMAMSINHLLHETKEMYRQRQSIEIALLQSQVNPHFLYNTLDSIRWMAVIQKCPGIANMLRSLVSLMKNIAKGTQDRIPLREELALLEDYITIQSVKYMEVFSFVNAIGPQLGDYRIIKLTLQPLVENAIFHGIEPTGECGTITLSGREEGEDLLLCVEDDGAGIEPELLDTLLTAEHEHDRSSMNGIGLANVHKRLQLTYGERYGLSVESVLGEYTRVTVRLPKEG